MEIWKNIPNYDGLYQISNLGRIRSLYKYKGINNIMGQEFKKLYQRQVKKYYNMT